MHQRYTGLKIFHCPQWKNIAMHSFQKKMFCTIKAVISISNVTVQASLHDGATAAAVILEPLTTLALGQGYGGH